MKARRDVITGQSSVTDLARKQGPAAGARYVRHAGQSIDEASV
jgi:hypothetical protein